MSGIDPSTLLDIGQRVSVGNRFGTVIKAEYKPAHPCGIVALHTIKFTEKQVYKCANTYKMESIKPVTQSVNYAFIQVQS